MKQTHFFTQEIADLKLLAVFLDDTVDGEVSVHCSHFVLEALCYTNDHIVDKAFNRSKAGDVLACTLPDSECHLVRLSFEEADVHVNMPHVLR